MCVENALFKAADETIHAIAAGHVISDMLGLRHEYKKLSDWNDDRSTTKDDVLHVLRRSAEKVVEAG